MLRNLIILLLVFLSLSAWLWVSGAGRGEADLRYISAVELRTLDPQRMTWLEDIRVAEGMFEGLVRVELPSLKIGPAVASHWSVSDDGLTYTFHLRPDARFSNGDPVTADDFRFSWMRAMMPDSAADYAQLFSSSKTPALFLPIVRSSFPNLPNRLPLMTLPRCCSSPKPILMKTWGSRPLMHAL
ncbi:MAG: hypothetical protein HC898_13290 [Phycisphaerales bacterium]|nr:hypothetical protein [Phycisphaerales bacterium]